MIFNGRDFKEQKSHCRTYFSYQEMGSKRWGGQLIKRVNNLETLVPVNQEVYYFDSL